MSRQRKTEEEIQEAKQLGRALAILRTAAGMTQIEVAEKAAVTKQVVCKIEHGSISPRHSVVKRLLSSMDVTVSALHRAQELIQDPSGEVNEGIEDAPDFRSSEEGHLTAVRLAQEAGKAVAHCCLAFMELQAGGWQRSSSE
jgi:transcriptional regulator with XRE-family HTH domain